MQIQYIPLRSFIVDGLRVYIPHWPIDCPCPLTIAVPNLQYVFSWTHLQFNTQEEVNASFGFAL